MLGDTIVEALDVVGDVDVFDVEFAAGDEFVVNVAVETTAPGRMQFRLDGELLLSEFATIGPHTTLDEYGTSRLIATTAGTRRLTVSGQTRVPPSIGAPRYRIELLRVNRSPEHLPSAFTLGDSLVGEQVDRPADVDTFTVQVTEGVPFSYSIRVDDMPAREELVVDVHDHAGELLGTTSLTTYDFAGAQFEWGSPITPSYTGAARFTVHARRMPGVPYVLATYAIDVAPENVSALLPFNAWVLGETMEVVGDVDRFHFLAEPGRGYAVHARVADDGVGLLRVRTSLPGVETTSYDGLTGAFSVDSARSVQVQIEPYLPWEPFLGSKQYELHLSEFSLAPETADSVIVLGDTISNEQLDLLGDIDRWRIEVTEGERLLITPIVLSGPGALPTLELSLLGPDGALLFSGVRTYGVGPYAVPTYYLSAGVHWIEIRGGTNGTALTDVGAYRLVVESLP
jgi:hypothetical protein